jgi:hypothetical protein
VGRSLDGDEPDHLVGQQTPDFSSEVIRWQVAVLVELKAARWAL